MGPAPVTRIAISSEGPALGDPVDPRFGRAAGFVVVDLPSGAWSYVDNGGSQALAQGAGIQAAEILARNDVQVLLTGHVGPKAAAALQAAGIRAVEGVEGISVAEALARYQQEAWRA